MAIFSRVIYGTAQIIQFSTADFKGKAWVSLSHTIIFFQLASGNDAKKKFFISGRAFGKPLLQPENFLNSLLKKLKALSNKIVN